MLPAGELRDVHRWRFPESRPAICNTPTELDSGGILCPPTQPGSPPIYFSLPGKRVGRSEDRQDAQSQQMEAQAPNLQCELAALIGVKADVFYFQHCYSKY